MRPFLLEFKETPNKQELDFSLIEYCTYQNLNIDRTTGKAAVNVLSLDTVTATWSAQESTDSDDQRPYTLVNTNTFTKADGESTDSDNSAINFLFDTRTATRTEREESDDDRNRVALMDLLDTTTLTESRETTDKDN